MDIMKNVLNKNDNSNKEKKKNKNKKKIRKINKKTHKKY